MTLAACIVMQPTGPIGPIGPGDPGDGPRVSDVAVTLDGLHDSDGTWYSVESSDNGPSRVAIDPATGVFSPPCNEGDRENGCRDSPHAIPLQWRSCARRHRLRTPWRNHCSDVSQPTFEGDARQLGCRGDWLVYLDDTQRPRTLDCAALGLRCNDHASVR